MIVGYTMLHYGTDYLAYALQSLAPYVDKHVILYSATPTFGSSTTLPCPDSRDELYAIAEGVLGSKLIWREGLPQGLPSILQLVPNADLILTVDGDEVWTPSLTANVLRNFRERRLPPGDYRLPMGHHWRSFGYICRDHTDPVRMTVLHGGSAGYPHGINRNAGFIHHFGYARTLADTRYKIETSAHKGEWRAEWWNEIFTAFPQRLTDLHPVVKDLWNAEPYDRQQLPDIMHHHPWFDQGVIA